MKTYSIWSWNSLLKSNNFIAQMDVQASSHEKAFKLAKSRVRNFVKIFVVTKDYKLTSDNYHKNNPDILYTDFWD